MTGRAGSPAHSFEDCSMYRAGGNVIAFALPD
jgi:hypothetical protein